MESVFGVYVKLAFGVNATKAVALNNCEAVNICEGDGVFIYVS